jgi:type II secretory pathway pseudopilin PulG
MNYKKGGMFGLDARIALAIFGALSVISGAALYSAIQQSKAIAIATSMQEFAKAYEQYILDTGEGMPANAGHATDVSAVGLVEDPGISGWKGPYLPYQKNGATYLSVNNSSIDSGYFVRAGIEEWTTSWPSSRTCDGSRKCYIWVSYYTAGANITESILQDLDLHFDGEADSNDGRFRYSPYGAHNYLRLLIGPSMRDKQN